MGRRGRPPYPDILTPREWEVLELLREGLSNPEIAARLGISRDGAKYHVSEILTKLGLTSREEAAAWQREPRRPWWAGIGAPLAWFRDGLGKLAASGAAGLGNVLAVVAIALVLSGLGLMAFFLMRGDGGGSPQGSEAVVVPMTELFTDARPRTAAEQRALPEQPAPAFEDWDGVSTVLYDTQEFEAHDLGPGTFGRFSGDGRWMVWTAGPPYEIEQHEAWVIELATLEQRRLGPGNFIRFLDGDRAYIRQQTGRLEIVDLETGRREVVDELPPQEPATTRVNGYVIRTSYGRASTTYNLRVEETNELFASFEAFRVVPAGSGELLVMTPVTDGWTNIFVVDIEAKKATFIASSPLTVIANWPVGADERYVVWTDDPCNYSEPRRTRIYDREAGRLIELDASLWPALTPDGLLADGTFGAKAVIDPETLEYVFVVPPLAEDAVVGSGSDVSWSPDYRYVSRGFAGGHGGMCP